MNKKLKILISFTLLCLFSLLPLNQIKADDGLKRTEYRIFQAKKEVQVLTFLPVAYKNGVALEVEDYVIQRKEGLVEWNDKTSSMLNYHVYVSSYYNRIAAYVQKDNTLINSTIIFINQHNINHADYIDGVNYFKEDIYNNEVLPILTNLQTIKNTNLTSFQEIIEGNLQSLKENFFLSDSTKIDTTMNSLNLELKEVLPETTDAFNLIVLQITENVQNILDIANNEDKIIIP